MFPNSNRNSFFLKFEPPARQKTLHCDAAGAELKPLVHDALYYLQACRGQISEWSILDGLPLGALWPLQLTLCGAAKHARSAHACRAPPLAAPLMSAAEERARATTLFAVMVVAFGAWGPMCVVVCAQTGLHACRSSGVKVRGAKEVFVHLFL